MQESCQLTHVSSAWGEWLSSYPWHYFATLTFKQERSHEAATHSFTRWVESLDAGERQDIGYFCGHEIGRQGRLHVHALLRCGRAPIRAVDEPYFGPHPKLSAHRLWESWFRTRGFARILPYDPARGAAGYVSKYVAKELSHFDIDNFGPQWRPVDPDRTFVDRLRERRVTQNGPFFA